MFLFIAGVLATAMAFPLSRLASGSEAVSALAYLCATAAATFIMLKFINRKPFGAIGLTIHSTVFREFGTGVLLGVLMMGGIFLVELALGYVSVSGRGLTRWEMLGVFFSALAVFSIAAAFEELLFRGYLFQTLIQGVTLLPALLLMAGLFAVAHARNPDATVFGVINVGLAGVWFSVAYVKTRGLWLPIGLHISWNFCQTTLFGFPTSGLAFVDRRLVDAVQSGPVWVTGGTFGPEGGALATVAILVCTTYVLKAGHLQAPPGITTLDSIEDLIVPRNGSGETTG
jgi:uncharacterized protein